MLTLPDTNLSEQKDALKKMVLPLVVAITGNPNIEVVFALGQTRSVADKIYLSMPESFDSDGIRLWRGYIDRALFRITYHDVMCENRYRPADPLASGLYSRLMQLRFELQGIRTFPGSLNNISAVYELGKMDWQTNEGRGLFYAIEYLCPEMIEFEPINMVADRTKLEPFLTVLKNTVYDIDEYAKFAAQYAVFICCADAEDDFFDIEDDYMAGSFVSAPESDPSENEELVFEDSSLIGANFEDEDQEDILEFIEDDQEAVDADFQNQEGGTQKIGYFKRHDFISEDIYKTLYQKFDYDIFKTDYDKVVDASQLLTDYELEGLLKNFVLAQKDQEKIIKKLARKLRLRLTSMQADQSCRDLYEGILDHNKISKILSDPLDGRFFRDETQIAAENTALTLLIDNSGSMRGKPITVAALCADIIAKTVENCGAKVEVLGFTTQEWRGGQSRKDYEAAGCPPSPGRLNDLHHIIYKDFNMTYKAAQKSIPVMLKEDLLKENIDGEALLWAASRLIQRPERRKILTVISDGAPVDDSTSSANENGYLEKHLKSVIHQIENKSNIDLFALGIGHDVCDYYRKAVTVPNPEGVAEALTERFVTLF